jgi:hypothetical protein
VQHIHTRIIDEVHLPRIDHHMRPLQRCRRTCR